jgi:hypothetical protein
MTRVDLGLAANAACFLVVGYALLFALGFAELRLRDVRLLGLSYLAGWALLGSVLSLTLIAGIDLGVATVVLVTAGLVAGCALVGTRTSRATSVPARQDRHPLAVLAVALAAVILLTAAVAAIVVAVKGQWNPDWDAVVFWIPRAETIYYSGGLDADVWGSLAHPEYPPLVPALDAATFHFVGGFHPSVLPFQQTLLGIAFLGAVLALLDRFVPRWVSVPSLALLVTTPWFWWRLQSPLPDQTLAYLVAAAALACVIWLHEKRGSWLGLALVCLTAATLTKLEGAFLATLLIAVVLAAGFTLYRRAALPALLLLLGPAAILPWRLWLHRHDLPTSAVDYHATDLFDPSYLAARTHRLSYAIHSMLDTAVGERHTAAILCLSVVVLFVVATRIPVITAAVGAWLLLSCVGLAAVYWIGRLEIRWYISTSAPRVGATIVIAAATLAPLLLGLALGRSPQPAASGEPRSTPGAQAVPSSRIP